MITTPVPIDSSRCHAWLGLSGLPVEYLSGGPAWLADRSRKIHVLTRCAGIVPHMPFGWDGTLGTDGEPSYSITQAAWMRGRSEDHRRIVDYFAPHMVPLVADGIRILPYLGATQLSLELARIPAARLSDRMRVLADNIDPIMQAGITEVSIDSSIDCEPTSSDGRLLAWWESLGLRIRIESTPNSSQTWAHARPIYVDERLWQGRKSMPQYAGVRLTGSVMRFVPAPSGAGLSGPAWGALWAARSAPSVRAIQAEPGHSAVVEALDDAIRFAPQCFVPVAAP